MEDIHVFMMWIRIFLVGAAICTTSVPVLYAFYPWRSRRFGQIFMLKAISFAFAMDVSAVLAFWQPKNIWVLFIADMLILTLIGISTALLTWQMWRMSHPKKKKGRHRK